MTSLLIIFTPECWHRGSPFSKTVLFTIFVFQGDFLQRPSVRMQLDRKSNSAGRLHGQWRMSSVDEHAGWKQQQVANGRSDLATALLDETDGGGDGGSSGDANFDTDVSAGVDAGERSESPQTPQMEGGLHEREWAAADGSRDQAESPAVVSIGPAMREWRQRRVRRHLWLTSRPADEPGWFTDGCEGVAVRLLGAFAPPPDPQRWRRSTAVVQPLLGPALLLALVRAKRPQISFTSPQAWVGTTIAVTCTALAGMVAVFVRTRDARPLQHPTRVVVAIWSLVVSVALGAACAAEASAALATVSALTQLPPLVLGFVLAAWATVALPTVDDLASAAAATSVRAHMQLHAPPSVSLVKSPAIAAICALGAAIPVSAAAVLRLCTKGIVMNLSEAMEANHAVLWTAVSIAVIVSVCIPLARLAWVFREQSRK